MGACRAQRTGGPTWENRKEGAVVKAEIRQRARGGRTETMRLAARGTRHRIVGDLLRQWPECEPTTRQGVSLHAALRRAANSGDGAEA